MDERLRERIRELTSSVRIREAGPTDADARAYCGLINEAYLRKVNPEYYRWQFFERPGVSRCLLAEMGGKTAATYGLCLRSTTAGTMMGLTVDAMVAPEFQRTGLFVRMEMEMEAIARTLGCRLLYSTPNDKAFQPRVTQLDWRPLPDRIAFACAEPVPPTSRRLSIEPLSRFGRETDAIFAGFARARPSWLLGERDSAYLDWRFNQNPRYRYAACLARHADRPVAYAVTKIFTAPEDGARSGDIVELIWSDADENDLRELLAHAVNQLRAEGATQVLTWLNADPMLQTAATAVGFAATAITRHVAWLPLDADPGATPPPERWFLTMADSEVY